jgi:hypothetical protein
MPPQVNSNYSTQYKEFVDFANKAYTTAKGGDTVARFAKAPQGDFKGALASLWRTTEMKSANDQVRDLFLQTIADMFGGEKNIPDLVRDNMRLEDFGKGKPLTARRIKLVATAVEMLGGGKFVQGPAVEKALMKGYLPAELPKLARVAHLYQQATECSDAEAEAAALDPHSAARRLFDFGGRFTLNAGNFKKGLALMEKFDAWYADLRGDKEAKRRDTPTKLNANFTVCTDAAKPGIEKFVFEEIASNAKLPLDAKNPEDVFGMAKNPAMQFVGRGYATSVATSLAQMPPEKRRLVFAVFNALDKLPKNAAEVQRARGEKIDNGRLVAARVIKHFDAVAALQKAGKLDRAHLVPLLYPDVEVPPNAGNREISTAYRNRLMQNPETMGAIHMIAENSGATIDEATAAYNEGMRLPNVISPFSAKLEEMDGTARGGRDLLLVDLNRASAPVFIAGEAPAIEEKDAKFVFRFPGGEKMEALTGLGTDPDVAASGNAIADKIAELCGNVHPKQLANVYYAMTQSGISSNVNGGFRNEGISSDEHMALTFTLSRNEDTGAITIKYSEPEGMPLKFNWTTTIDVEGNAVSTPMLIDNGQYETQALGAAKPVGEKLPAKTKEAGEAFIRDILPHCGDDFALKGIVAKNMRALCIDGANNLRTTDQIKARIDAIRANLEEIRRVAAGSARIEKAGIRFLEGLGGKSVPPGLIGKIFKTVAGATPGDFSKLSATSTPQQILKGVMDMREAVEEAILEAKVRDFLEGGDDMLATRDFVASLILTKFTAAELRNVNASFRSETASKLIAVLDDFVHDRYPAGTGPIDDDLSDWIQSQSTALGQLAPQFNRFVEDSLGQNGDVIGPFGGQFDKKAFGAKDLFKMVSADAQRSLDARIEGQRREGVVDAAFEEARPRAANAYAKAGPDNAEKVDRIIRDALRRCSDNDDAVQVVAANVGTLLVSNTAELRSLQEVRERVDAIAANFRELKALSKNNPDIYEAGKRMMLGMGGKALSPGMIARLVSAAANAPVDALRKLSSRSSAPTIHRAVTQLRDGLVRAMDLSGAEQAAGGPDEKQACRNFVAALMLKRCGDKTLRAMQGAFRGDTAAKLLSLYAAIGDGHFNGGIERQTAMRIEDQAASHMAHIGVLKAAIDLAVDGQPGAALDPFPGELDPDSIDGGDIFADLETQATR